MKRTFLFLFLVLSVLAQALPQNRVKWSVQLVPADLRPGEHGQAIIKGAIEKDWHIYGLTKPAGKGPFNTKITVGAGGLTSDGSPEESKPIHKMDEGFGIEVDVHATQVEFKVPVVFKDSSPSKITIETQACNSSNCELPKSDDLEIKFTPGTGSVRPEYAKSLSQGAAKEASTTSDSTTTQLNAAKSNGLLSFIWFSFLAGLTALLTPCVFPMIPITVSFFTKQRPDGSQPTKNLSGAIAYCLGILISFTALGVLVTLIFGASGLQALATNVWVNVFLAALFIVLALSLFEVINLTLPTGLVNKIGGNSKRGGWVGPAFMGVTFSLTTFTCTVPFVGTLLIAATQGEKFYPIVGMLAFSSAFALPFFFLALFPQYLAKLPRSGSWLSVVKAFMGFLELAAAMKFISNVDLSFKLHAITQSVFLAVWSMIFAVAALYLFGWIRLGHESGDLKIGWFRRLFAIATVGVSGYCLAAINGYSLGDFAAFLPPDPYPGTRRTADKDGLNWLDKYSKAIETAKQEKKPLFIDFTGVYCTNCRWVEKNIFTKSVVIDQLKKATLVSLYTDDGADKDANQKLQQKLTNSVTLPIYVVVDPNTEKPVSIFPGSQTTPEQFAKFLSEAYQKVK